MRSALLRLLGSSPRGAPRDACVAGTLLRGPISTVFGYGSLPASRASAGTTIFHKNEAPTYGCGKWSPGTFHCFRIVIYNGWRNSNVSSRKHAAARNEPCAEEVE